MSDFVYVPDWEWRRGFKRMHANERRLIAQEFRRMRREEPEMAKLLWRRLQDFRVKLERQIAESLFSSTEGWNPVSE